jgi:hypothetical protein
MDRSARSILGRYVHKHGRSQRQRFAQDCMGGNAHGVGMIFILLLIVWFIYGLVIGFLYGKRSAKKPVEALDAEVQKIKAELDNVQ